MKRGNILIFLTAFVLAVNIIAAADTEIIVNTLPNHRVDISALRVSENPYDLIESFHENSGEEGVVSVTLSSDESTFNLAVWVKQDNSIVKYEKFEDEFPAGEPVNLELYPDWYLKQKEIEKQMAERNSPSVSSSVSAESNNTDNETTETIPLKNTSSNNAVDKTNSNESGNKISFFNVAGSAVFGEEGLLSKKTVYYIIGGIVLIVLVFIGLKFVKKMKGKSGSYFNSGGKSDMDLIAADERKIREAKEEIERIKSRENNSEKEKKILEAKKKLIDDEKELIRLRRGGTFS